MSTVNEILGLSDEVVDKTLTVDNDLRIITIPSSVRILGVESDDEVHRIQWKIPRYCGEFDLSEFTIRVNYRNALGGSDRYDVDDDTVDETNNVITFSWLVGRYAFVSDGNVKFSLCLMKYADDSITVVKEFNTTWTELPVLEGLETSEAIVQEYPDVLEGWRNQLFEIRDVNLELIDNAINEGVTAINARTTENVEKLNDTVEEFEDWCDSFDQFLFGVETGNALQLKKCKEAPPIGLNVYGKSERISTTGSDQSYPQEIVIPGESDSLNIDFYGKNLVQNTATSQTVMGVTFTVNDDGSITANGTSTVAEPIAYNIATVQLPAGKYLVSGQSEGADNSYLRFTDQDGYFLQQHSGVDASLVLTETTPVTLYLVILGSATVSNLTVYPMIRSASYNDNTYEPYIEPQSVMLSTEKGLPGIDITGTTYEHLANHTDINGRKWICDEIDVERGIYIQRIGRYENNGTNSTWGVNQQNDSTIIYMTQTPCRPIEKVKQLFNTQSFNWTMSLNSEHNSGAIGTSGILYCICSCEHLPAVEMFKAYLQQNPLVCLYALSEPVKRALTESEINSYRAVMLNTPNTTVINLDNVDIRLSYPMSDIGVSLAKNNRIAQSVEKQLNGYTLKAVSELPETGVENTIYFAYED